MIAKVLHGWKVGGLVAYLMGPGRAQEHRRPRVVASWDGRDAGWQPASTGAGEWDLELGPLIRALRAPGIAAGLPEKPPEPGARGYVWHCPVRNAADDRILSDGEWAEIARELVDAAGVARRGDVGGARWVAIRHDDDHIHLVVVLVRQDTARRFWPHNDYPKLRRAAQAIERRLGLTSTAPRDGTAAPAPVRGELEKAARTGTPPARVELARAVKEAAVASGDLVEFCGRLRAAGYLVEIRRASSGDPIGYKVARAQDRTASGEPVFYSGRKLAPDLSLPRLQQRWATTPASAGTQAIQHRDGRDRNPDSSPDGNVFRAASGEVERARRVLRRASRRAARGAGGGAGEGDVEDIAHGVGDLVTALAALARSRPELGLGDLARAAEAFDRAARPPRGSPGSTSVLFNIAGGRLRSVARGLSRQPWFGPHTGGGRGAGSRERDEDLGGAVALMVALAALMQEIAAWQRARGHAHQAAAAESAAASTAEAAIAVRRATTDLAVVEPSQLGSVLPGPLDSGRQDQARRDEPTTRRRATTRPRRQP